MLDGLGSDRNERQMKIDRQISRIGISTYDMEQCREFTSAWDVTLSEAIKRALITAAVISYARPFSGNEEHPEATGKPPFSANDLTHEEQQLHERLCNIRNQAIAHSDFNMRSSRPVEYPTRQA